jgi:hypothetical protein
MFPDPDRRTRWMMMAILDQDEAAKTVYLSPLLTEDGQDYYISCLRDAANTDGTNGPEHLTRLLLSQDWVVAAQIAGNGTERAVLPEDIERLAWQEFNRLYCRAICRRAVEEGEEHVEVCWAVTNPQPNPDAESHVGQRFEPTELLNRLNSARSLEEAIGVPRTATSGLSVRLPQH